MNAGILLFLAFAVCIIIGVPISMSLGIGALTAVLFGNLGVSPAVIAQRIFGGLQSVSIMAIAFFILAGNLFCKRLNFFCKFLKFCPFFFGNPTKIQRNFGSNFIQKTTAS